MCHLACQGNTWQGTCHPCPQQCGDVKKMCKNEERVTWKSPSVPIPQWLQGWGDEDVLREDVFQGRQSRADFLVRSSSWLWFLCWSAKGVVFSITTCNYSAVAAEGEWSCSSFPPADTWVLLLVWALLLHYQVSQWSCCLLGSESTVGNCCLLSFLKGKGNPCPPLQPPSSSLGHCHTLSFRSWRAHPAKPPS